MSPEVVVIGAGPAGSAAARVLAERGVRVCLVERSRFPRPKACGDGLTPPAVRLLGELGVAVALEPAVVGVVVRGLGEGGIRAAHVFQDGLGTVLPRALLDERLATAAAAAGADLRTETRAEGLLVEDGRVVGVSVRGPGGGTEAVRAPVTILAEGSVAALSRQVPRREVRHEHVAFAIRQYLEGVEWTGEKAPSFEIVVPLESGAVTLAGYSWVFPGPADSANVGLGFFSETPGPARLHELLAEFIARLRQQDFRFRNARVAGRPIGAPVRLGGRGSTSHAPGVLLVGDCAGLPNPYWAEGIAEALESGGLAARTTLDFLGAGGALADYGLALAQRFPNYERSGRALPAQYRALRHVARDVAGFLALPGRLPRTFFQTLDARSQTLDARQAPARMPEADSLDALAVEARRRAQRLAGCDRPLFAEILAQLDRVDATPTPVVEVFLAARVVAAPSTTGQARDLRRAGTVLELLRTACAVLREIPPTDSAAPGRHERGGSWLASTLVLSLGDRLLARAFALASRLEPHTRIPVCTALREMAEALARASEQERRAPDATQVSRWLVIAAARAGARAGGASEDTAHRIAEAAPEVGSELTRSAAAGESLAFPVATVAERLGRFRPGRATATA